MTIDNTPAIKAFAQERIRQLIESIPTDMKLRVIDEMLMIVALCDGLTRQSEMLDAALHLAHLPISAPCPKPPASAQLSDKIGSETARD